MLSAFKQFSVFLENDNPDFRQFLVFQDLENNCTLQPAVKNAAPAGF